MLLYVLNIGRNASLANFSADGDVLGGANDIDDYINDDSSVELHRPSSIPALRHIYQKTTLISQVRISSSLEQIFYSLVSYQDRDRIGTKVQTRGRGVLGAILQQ